MPDKVDLRCLTWEELERFVVDLGWKRYRAMQIWQWVWARNAADIAAMTDLSLGDRERLSAVAYIDR
ncbi:MAG: 23S rRNA (adenine(2503)-C(2))-methyltransferase RlmN, partial [Mailhella sp.]|nr:23S rRNA (adenine(2503)-C(2))-methyltransferase RlmN [Mailhella sp.]